MTKRRCRKQSSRRGAAIVEFAFIVPVFLTLVVGMVELSRATVVLQVLTNASREGARIASYDTTATTGPITSAVNSYLSSEGISGATTVVSPSPPSSVADGQSISVTVSISYDTVRWLPSSFYLGGQTLQATTTMCREPAL
jgi:Flp pilus assembly protein TadG